MLPAKQNDTILQLLQINKAKREMLDNQRPAVTNWWKLQMSSTSIYHCYQTL